MESHVLESGVHFPFGIKCHRESRVIAHLETSIVWNQVSGDRFPESNVRESNVLESNETHPLIPKKNVRRPACQRVKVVPRAATDYVKQLKIHENQGLI